MMKVYTYLWFNNENMTFKCDEIYGTLTNSENALYSCKYSIS